MSKKITAKNTIGKTASPLKKALWIPVGFFTAAAGALLGISLYSASSMTRIVREPLDQKPDNLGLPYTDVSFQSTDGLMIYGWWIESGSKDRAIIMVHGTNRNRADYGTRMLDMAQNMVHAGYNVLMFDLRAHGQSEGKRTSLGFYEQRDLLGAIEYVKQRGIHKICVIGFSMGAAVALMTAAKCNTISAIVADSSFAYLKDIIEPQFTRRSRLPKFLIPLILFWAKMIHHIDLSIPRPIDAVKECTDIPVLFIHGGQDKTVPVEHASILADAASNDNNRVWIVPEAEHIGAYRARSKEYVNRVLSFFNRSLKSSKKQ